MRYHPLDPPRPLYYRMARSAHFLQAGLPQPMKPIAERERVADSGLVQCPRPSEQTIFLVHLIPNNGSPLASATSATEPGNGGQRDDVRSMPPP